MKRLQYYGSRLTLMGSVLLLAAGCGDRQAEDEVVRETDEITRGGTAVVAELADINQPMPLLFQTALDGNLTADVMNMELLRGRWQDGQLVYQTAEEHPMAIARSYEYVGPDSTALRFHMRSDLKWSDGTPLTARDVAFTYEMLGNPDLASPRQDYTEHLDSVVVESDSTVVFHFERRYPEMIAHAAHPLAPRHVYADVPPAEIRTHPTILEPANGNLVVSGPWMIGQWEKGQRIVLVPNPHFRPQPHLDQIVIRIIPEVTTRLVELQTGNVDFMQGVPFEHLPNLRTQENVRLERQHSRFYDYIAYNPEAHPAFADPEIRRALGLALDVPALLRALQMEEYAVPAGGPYPPIFKNLYDPQRTPPLPHDPEEARRILEDKGWRDTNDDGIRDKDGRPLRFTLVTNTGNQRRADASQIAQQQWKQIGVDARLQQLEFNTMMERLIGRNYEAALGGWGVALTPDLTTLWGAESPFNITGYQDPEVSALFQRALAQPTKEAALPFWRQAAVELVRDQPYTWLYYFDDVAAVRNRLRNTRVDTYGPYQNTWEWWIPRNQQRGRPAGAQQ